MSERERLRAKSRRLRSEMRKLGPMIKDSVIFREMRCGKPICKCTSGEPHLYLCVVYAEMDIIVYREKGFKEPWFLLVPAFSEKLLPTELVIEWYRARMNIETSFRDFKSLLGVRGISLKVRKAKGLNRLLARKLSFSFVGFQW